MINLDHLQYFAEAARLQHLTRAAQAVHKSPSAVSHAIASLERDLGRPLFDRQGKRILLTPEGRVLAEQARDLLRRAASLRDAMDAAGGLAGRYRVAATHLLCAERMVPACAALQKANPRLSFEIWSLRSADVMRLSDSGELDLGLCLGAQSRPDLEVEQVYKGQLWCTVRRGHPALRKQGADRVRELERWPRVFSSAFPGVEIHTNVPAFRRYGLTWEGATRLDSYETLLEYVKVSDAWSLIPDFIVRGRSRHFAGVVPKDWRAPFSVSLVRPFKRQTDNALEALSESLRRGFRRS